jgi:hypothetical protein
VVSSVPFAYWRGESDADLSADDGVIGAAPSRHAVARVSTARTANWIFHAIFATPPPSEKGKDLLVSAMQSWPRALAETEIWEDWEQGFADHNTPSRSIVKAEGMTLADCKESES